MKANMHITPRITAAASRTLIWVAFAINHTLKERKRA